MHNFFFQSIYYSFCKMHWFLTKLRNLQQLDVLFEAVFLLSLFFFVGRLETFDNSTFYFLKKKILLFCRILDYFWFYRAFINFVAKRSIFSKGRKQVKFHSLIKKWTYFTQLLHFSDFQDNYNSHNHQLILILIFKTFIVLIKIQRFLEINQKLYRIEYCY